MHCLQSENTINVALDRSAIGGAPVIYPAAWKYTEKVCTKTDRTSGIQAHVINQTRDIAVAPIVI